MVKFTNEFWLEVRKDFDAGLTQSELRKKYGLSKGALGNKIKRDFWNLQTARELIDKAKIIIQKEKAIKTTKPKQKIVEKPKTIKPVKIKEDIKNKEVFLEVVENIQTDPVEIIPIEENTTIEINPPVKKASIYDTHLETVKSLLIAEVENSRIASVIGVTEEVFNNLFYEEIENALIIADAEVINAIRLAATDLVKPNAQAQKLWLEIQAKRQDNQKKSTIEANPFLVDFDAPKTK